MMKYRNKSCRYGNRIYHSRREANDALWLDSLKLRKIIKEVIPQCKISLYVNEQFIANHFVDFKVILNDGRIKYVETKGMWTEVYRLKLKLVRALFPDIEYLINPNEKKLLI